MLGMGPPWQAKPPAHLSQHHCSPALEPPPQYPAAPTETRCWRNAHLPTRPRRRQRRLAFGLIPQAVAALVLRWCSRGAEAIHCKTGREGGREG